MEQQIPEGATHYSDHFRSQIGVDYHFKFDGKDWLLYNFTLPTPQWEKVISADKWILDEIKPLSE